AAGVTSASVTLTISLLIEQAERRVCIGARGDATSRSSRRKEDQRPGLGIAGEPTDAGLWDNHPPFALACQYPVNVDFLDLFYNREPASPDGTVEACVSHMRFFPRPPAPFSCTSPMMASCPSPTSFPGAPPPSSSSSPADPPRARRSKRPYTRTPASARPSLTSTSHPRCSRRRPSWRSA